MRRLIVLGLVVVLVAVMSAPAALFATGGGNGDNGGNGGCDKKSSSKCEYKKKTICHIPPGNPGNAHTIRVSVNALPAHLAHGDTLGPCNGKDNGKKHNGDDRNGKKHKGDDRNGKKHRGDDRR